MTALCGGIDLGGTKIEARLFAGPHAETRDVRRVPTPTGGFEAMMDALVAQASWLDGVADGPVAIGLAVPGIVDPATGVCFAANVPSSGRALGPMLSDRVSRPVPVVNDCMAFAYSEAHGGAGEGVETVMGLVLGTGVGGGFCVGGRLPYRHAGLAVEVGHLGLPARALARHDLPLWPCGCGRDGCLERYISGTGIANLAEHRLGERLSAELLAARANADACAVLDVWADLAAEALDAIQIMLDPDRIVLGGGVSNMPGVAGRLTDALSGRTLGSARPPDIRTARHGDTSGARGAALIARDAWT